MNQRNEIERGEHGAAPDWGHTEGQFAPGRVSAVRAVVVACRTITQKGVEYVKRSFSAPSRAVRSTHKSMSGKYPSRKMGTTIQFESHSLEAAAILTLESDESTVGYVDQPEPVKVEYKRNGRRRCHRQTPDFLRIQRGKGTLVECKPLEQILARNARDPDYYVLQGEQWVCPALQAAAAELGFTHEVWAETYFSPVHMRNVRMTVDYMCSSAGAEEYEVARIALMQLLNAKARATVSDVLRDLGSQICIDHVYRAIATRDVAFDWRAASLTEPGECYLYRDDHTLRAFHGMESARVPAERRISGAGTELREGSPVNWDGKIWLVLNLGAQYVMLGRGDEHRQMPRAVVDALIKGGLMRSADEQVAAGVSNTAHEMIAKARSADLRCANLRHKRLLPYLGTGKNPQGRTLRRYLASYRAAERQHGTGFIGLIPGFATSGNRQPRLAGAVLEIALEVAQKHYANCSNKSKAAVYLILTGACDEKSLPVPCYSWFCRFLDALPKHRLALARRGSKGAYSLEPRVDLDDARVDSEPDRPWERAHVDHTLVDVETIFGETSEGLGRPWLTVMVDHFSRRVLAFHLTYEPPSYRSLLMVIRKCVQRWGRLPDALLVDGGKEFRSIWFQTTCAIYSVTIIYRPVGKPRFGSQGERLFGTLDQALFHLLSGNTQLRKNVRQMTRDVDPNRHAIWSLPELNKLIEKFLYETYDITNHSELLVSPRHLFERGMERHGLRAVRLVPYDKQFIITTCPGTDKGTAKVQPDGVKVQYTMYSHPELQKHVGASVEVRYDPFDKSKVWAYVSGRWLELKTRHKNLLRLFGERDIDLAIAEWKRRRNVVAKARLNEAALIKFLQEILRTETLLLERRRAAEERRLRGMQVEEAEDSSEAWAEDESDGFCSGAERHVDREAGDADPFALDTDSLEVLQSA